MAWYDEDSWITNGLAPYKSTIIIAFIITVLLPILTHLYLYRAVAATKTPTFIVVGPSGSGKTTLVTKLDTSKAAQTHTSQAPQTVQAYLPHSTRAHSARFRSENDFETAERKPLVLTDTPGHGKLRHHAYRLTNATGSLPTGVIFVVDAANLSAGSKDGGASALNDTATYLHDYLLHMQRQHTKRKTSKSVEVPFLIAANKNDLFTALPAQLVKSALENEITNIRRTKAAGISAVGNVGKGEGLGGDEDVELDETANEPLGGTTQGKFDFAVMAEWNVIVDVVAGNATGEEDAADDDDDDEAGVEGWWDWIAKQM